MTFYKFLEGVCSVSLIERVHCVVHIAHVV